MPNIINLHLEELYRLCRRFSVPRFDLFGSATGNAFDIQRSDINVIVDCGPGDQAGPFNCCFSLKKAPENLFGRKVDLVMPDAMVKPNFIASANPHPPARLGIPAL